MIAEVRIDPHAVFDDGALYQLLGLSSNTLAEARKAGTLRFTRKGNRTLYLGQWILNWLESSPASGKPEGVAHA